MTERNKAPTMQISLRNGGGSQLIKLAYDFLISGSGVGQIRPIRAAKRQTLAEGAEAHATITDRPNMLAPQSCTAIMPNPAAMSSLTVPARNGKSGRAAPCDANHRMKAFPTAAKNEATV